MDAKEIVTKLMEYKGMNAPTFAALLDVTVQTIYDILNGRTAKLSPRVRAKIFREMPEVNQNWIFTGAPPMLTSPGLNPIISIPIDTKKRRLLDAIAHLKANGMLHRQRDIVDKMGSTPANVSKALSGDEAFLTDSFLRRFNAAYDNIFSNDWLLFGTGEMLAPVRVQPEHSTDAEKEMSYLRGKLDGFREAMELLHGQQGASSSEGKKGIV